MTAATSTTPHGYCQTCRHWIADGERLRSWRGECRHLSSPHAFDPTESDDGCTSWQSTKHPRAQSRFSHAGRRL